METKLLEITSYLDKLQEKKETVSQASVGWQINHVLSVINGVCLTLLRSKKEDYKWKFNLLKSYIFLVQKFPRGKAKAPKNTIATEQPTIEEIEKQVQNATKLLAKLNALPAKSHFNHPLFGTLHLKDSKKFLKIHTEHHLKIIRDILK